MPPRMPPHVAPHSAAKDPFRLARGGGTRCDTPRDSAALLCNRGATLSQGRSGAHERGVRVTLRGERAATPRAEREMWARSSTASARVTGCAVSRRVMLRCFCLLSGGKLAEAPGRLGQDPLDRVALGVGQEQAGGLVGEGGEHAGGELGIGWLPAR